MKKGSAEFIFTPKNLIRNLKKLGAWSTYGLASRALKHYFPKEYGEDKYTSAQREVELLKILGGTYWQDVVKMYHKEVGYTKDELSNTDCVNAF